MILEYKYDAALWRSTKELYSHHKELHKKSRQNMSSYVQEAFFNTFGSEFRNILIISMQLIGWMMQAAYEGEKYFNTWYMYQTKEANNLNYSIIIIIT